MEFRWPLHLPKPLQVPGKRLGFPYLSVFGFSTLLTSRTSRFGHSGVATLLQQRGVSQVPPSWWVKVKTHQLPHFWASKKHPTITTTDEWSVSVCKFDMMSVCTTLNMIWICCICSFYIYWYLCIHRYMTETGRYLVFILGIPMNT